MNKDIEDIVKKQGEEIKVIQSAFDTDEKGNPDYEQHKKDHGKEKETRENRSRILSDVSSWAVIGIVTLMLSHFFQSIKTFLTTIGK